jgi:Uma2 family endonuclease
MATLIRTSELEERLHAERRASGADRWDEVWEGMYVMAPLPNDEHQYLQQRLSTILDLVIGFEGKGDVRPGVNVSDREDWTTNYRCPDVVVFLKGTTAQNRNTFWLGGPDFAIEIVSPDDASRDKLEFYARVGVRELLIIDRDPWSLELYRLQGRRMISAGQSVGATVPNADTLQSRVVPLTFRLIQGRVRPLIEVTHEDGVQRWTV